MTIDIKLAILFILGMFTAFLWYLQEMVEQKELIETHGLVGVTILSFVNSVLGGLVAVIVYYGLTQFFPELLDYLKVGIASATAFFTKNITHAYKEAVSGVLHRMVKSATGGLK